MYEVEELITGEQVIVKAGEHLVFIPMDEGNVDYIEYLDWVEATAELEPEGES